MFSRQNSVGKTTNLGIWAPFWGSQGSALICGPQTLALDPPVIIY